MYHTEPPTDKTIREWYMNSSRVAACALRNEQAVRAHGKHCRYPLNERHGGLYERFEHFGKEKGLFPLQGFELRMIQSAS